MSRYLDDEHPSLGWDPYPDDPFAILPPTPDELAAGPLGVCDWCGRTARLGRECLACGSVHEHLLQCSDCPAWLEPGRDFIVRSGPDGAVIRCEDCHLAAEQEVA